MAAETSTDDGPADFDSVLAAAERIAGEQDGGGGDGALRALTDLVAACRSRETLSAAAPASTPSGRLELLRRASHDLREPCALINGYASMIRDMPAMNPNERTEFANIICRVSEQMMATIGNLGDVDRILSGAFTVDRSEQSLYRIANECLRVTAPLLENKDIRLDADLVETDPILLDPLRIHQLIKNLLENAVKFSHRGGTVRVFLREKDAEQEIMVSDAGQGMAEGEMGRLYEPFYRTSTLSTEGEHGSGLGLTLCQAIVLAHGGRINIESRFGYGTQVTVRLPTAG